VPGSTKAIKSARFCRSCSDCGALGETCPAFPVMRRPDALPPTVPGTELDAIRQERNLSAMSHGYKKPARSREAAKNGPPLGLVIALAAACGMAIGSAGTYVLTKPLAGPKQSGSTVAVGTPQAQTVTMPAQQQFKPAPQPPGEVPPGKVWSVEHGHWHDAPVAMTTPPSATTAPATAPAAAAAPVTVTPTVTTAPPPPATPAEKK
jgi:hypothetical protein